MVKRITDIGKPRKKRKLKKKPISERKRLKFAASEHFLRIIENKMRETGDVKFQELANKYIAIEEALDNVRVGSERKKLEKDRKKAFKKLKEHFEANYPEKF